MSDRVIFLDIDGPMIPDSMFLVYSNPSFTRKLAQIPVAVMKRLVEKTGAKIVFNTTHNMAIPNVPDIVDVVIAAGISEGHIHPDRKTLYPDTTRENAVLEWLSRHPETTDWVAFDDATFTKPDNLIWVDPETGLTIKHLNAVLHRWGYKGFFVE